MKSSTRDDYLDRIRRVLRFVQDHLDEPLTPERLAGVAHFSRFHFHRVFSGLVGESLSAHVRRLRLERAAGELRWTDRPVIDIALDAGYDAPEPFTRAFRGHFGEPPSRFRTRRDPLVVSAGGLSGSFRHRRRDRALRCPTGAIHHDRRTHRNPALPPLSRHGASRQLQAIGETFARSARSPTPRPRRARRGLDRHLLRRPRLVPTAQLRSHACIAVRDGVTTRPRGAS